MFDETCTVYTRSVDPLTRRETWSRLVLSGMIWQSGNAVSETHDPRNGSVLLYFPAAVCDDAGWTPREGDLVFRGEKLPGTELSVPGARGTAYTIVSTAEHRYGSEKLHHWEVCAVCAG